MPAARFARQPCPSAPAERLPPPGGHRTPPDACRNPGLYAASVAARPQSRASDCTSTRGVSGEAPHGGDPCGQRHAGATTRSEERRVGKEWSSGGEGGGREQNEV